MKPAPVPSETIEKLLLSGGQSRTLPADAYSSADVFAWEQKELFEGGWMCLGRLDDLLSPGQLRAIELGAETILLSRQPDGPVAAFSNVCRHRGHELLGVGERVDARQIRCPYHSWAYRLDGTLRAAPTLTQSPGFDVADWPLQSVRVGEWLGWLFVNGSGVGETLEATLGSLGAVLASYEPARLVGAVRHDYEVAANWKLIAENYLECYHCTTIHPALCEVSPPSSGRTIPSDGMWCGGTMDLKPQSETMSFSGERRLPRFRNLAPGLEGEVLYLLVMPNLFISAHPDYLMTHLMTPGSPGRTRVVCEWLFAPEAAEGDDFDPSYAVDFWDQTNQEDWVACEGVQRGTSNRGFQPGPLSSWESSLAKFHAMIGRAYLGEGFVPPPLVEWDPYIEGSDQTVR